MTRNPLARTLPALIVTAALGGCAVINEVADQVGTLTGHHPQLTLLQPLVMPLGVQVSINHDSSGGRYLLSRNFFSVPLRIGADLAQPPIRSVSVGGVALPMDAAGRVALDAPSRASLGRQGLSPSQIADLENLLQKVDSTLRRAS